MASPRVYIQYQTTELVLAVEGKVIAGAKVVLGKKASQLHQQWIVDNGAIVSAADATLAIDIKGDLVKGAEVVVGQRKGGKQWGWHRGNVLSKKNLDLALLPVSDSAGAHVTLQETKDAHHQWKIELAAEGVDYIPTPSFQIPASSLFDPSVASNRVDKLWSLDADFGPQKSAYHVFLDEIVSDRYSLVNGLQLLRDELQLAFVKGGDLTACAADLSVPTVITTLAHTNCGDRINQGSVSSAYKNVVASRFSTLAEDGGLKTEIFTPAGGGTDGGGVLAHVTVGHQLDEVIRHRFYDGNIASYILVNIDLTTHVGVDTDGGKLTFGKAKESEFREPRAACGAIIGTLTGYSAGNGVHQRLRKDLGEANFKFLQDKLLTPDGTDIRFVVAAAIIAIQGLHDTCWGLTTEIDQRGLAHLTASVTLNCPDNGDLFYLARATVFLGEIKIQGLGLDASKYSGKVVEQNGKKSLVLIYDGKDGANLPVVTHKYKIFVPSTVEQ